MVVSRVIGFSLNVTAATLDVLESDPTIVGKLAFAGFSVNLLSTLGAGSAIVLAADQFELNDMLFFDLSFESIYMLYASSYITTAVVSAVLQKVLDAKKAYLAFISIGLLFAVFNVIILVGANQVRIVLFSLSLSSSIYLSFYLFICMYINPSTIEMYYFFVIFTKPYIHTYIHTYTHALHLCMTCIRLATDSKHTVLTDKK